MTIDLGYAAQAAESWRASVENDPLRRFLQHEKHAKQTEFLESPEREVFMLGGNRSGKTKALCAYAAQRVRFEGAKLIWIVSPSDAMSRSNVVPQLYGGEGGIEPFIPEREIATTREKPDREVIGKDGWKIVLKSCEQGYKKFAGAAVDDVLFDEPPEWPVYNECVIRFGAGKTCRIKMAATILPPPGQSGGVCSWLWSEKIKPWLDGKNRLDTRIIAVAMGDNPGITPEQLELARRLYPVGSLDYRIRVLGELLPGLVGARCYSRFDRRLHVNKTLGPKDVDPLKPLYLGCDFNVDPLCAVLAQKHGRIWRFLDEIVLRPGTVPEMAAEVCSRYGATHRNELIVCGDATGNKRTAQTGKTDYELLVAGLQDTFTVRLNIPTKNPPERDRVNLFNFFLGGADSEVMCEVSDQCPELIADLEQVLWASDGAGIKKSKDKTDPYYQRTHTSDGAGYILNAKESHAINAASRPKRAPSKRPTLHYGLMS